MEHGCIMYILGKRRFFFMNSRQNTEFFGKIVFYVGYFDYFREFQSLPFRVLPLRDLDTIDRLNKDSLL